MEHICTNCGNQYTEAFCNRCGQKTTHRITGAHIWHDLVHAFTHADKGIFHLLLQMFRRPGKVAREYIIEGKRKRYFNPFQYILIIGSIAAFVAVNSHFMEQMISSTAPASQSARQAEFIKTVTHYQSKYYNIMLLLQLPFYALGTFLLFRKYKLNYAEHLTLHTFLTAQLAVFGMALMIVIGVLGKRGIYISSVMAVLSSAYTIFACMQFFRQRSFGGFVRSFAANMVGMVFFFLFVAIIMMIGVIIMIAATKGAH